MMRLTDVVAALELRPLTNNGEFESDVISALVCDLLSVVLAKAQESDLWITIQRHQNIVAVAKVTSVAGVILADGVVPEQGVIDKVSQEGVILLATDKPAFAVCGLLFALLNSEKG